MMQWRYFQIDDHIKWLYHARPNVKTVPFDVAECIDVVFKIESKKEKKSIVVMLIKGICKKWI